MSTGWNQVLDEAPRGPDRFHVAAGMRLMHLPHALRLMRWVAQRDPRLPTPHRPSAAFVLDIIRRLYTEHPERVVWASVLVPSELLWGLGLAPFYPELAATGLDGLGVTARGLATAADAGCPVDLCTVHRDAFGLARNGLYPPVGTFVATSSLCNLAGIMLATDAYRTRRPFTLIDVPPLCDSASLDYVEAQLTALVGSLGEATGAHLEPDQMRQAVRWSNQARELLLELNRLRASRPAPIRGGHMLGRSGLAAWLLGHPDGVEHYRAWRDYAADRMNRRDPEQANQKIRLLWLHLGPHVKTGLLAHLEDDLGAAIVFEEHDTFWWEELDETRPLRSLAAKILTHPGNGPVEGRVSLILDCVNRYQCDGVVHFSQWGCRQSTAALRVIRDQLRARGIPLLDLDGDSLDPTNTPVGPLRTRIDAFVETLS